MDRHPAEKDDREEEGLVSPGNQREWREQQDGLQSQLAHSILRNPFRKDKSKLPYITSNHFFFLNHDTFKSGIERSQARVPCFSPGSRV